MDNRPMFNPDGFRRVPRVPQEPAHRPMFQPPGPQIATQEPLPTQQPVPVRHHIPSAHEVPKKHHRGGLGRFLKRRWWVILMFLVLLVATSVLAYAYNDARSEVARLSAQNSNDSGTSDSSDDLVDGISKYLQLPNETPTIATVSDISKLKGQEFFKNAQNGDKVLIFQESGRALLYRPSIKMIIEYAKVDLSDNEQAQPTEQMQP